MEGHGRSGEAGRSADLADGAGVEAVVDQVLEIFAHADLPHQLVLVPVHARQLAHMRKDVLQCICQLERVGIAEPVLHVRVDDELGQAQDLAAEVERVAKPRLLPLLRRQRLDGLEVEVVVEVQVVQVLAVNEQVEHVVPLPAHLHALAALVAARSWARARLRAHRQCPLQRSAARASNRRRTLSDPQQKARSCYSGPDTAGTGAAGAAAAAAQSQE